MSGVRVRRQQDILWLVLDHAQDSLLLNETLASISGTIRSALAHAPRLIVLMGTGEQVFWREQATGEKVQATAAEMVAAFAEARAQQSQLVALVKGRATGIGCELVILCDTVIAREDATFQLPEAGQALFPGSLSTYLPAAVGQKAAQRLIHERPQLSAEDAMRLGLVHQTLASTRFLQDVEELLVMLATMS